MSLTSFFLVTFDDDSEDVRRAGWTYLVATHLGTAFLLGMFLLLGRGAATLDFDAFAAAGGAASTIFCLALVGFGTKAGLMPFHVWLPEAHPAAPSHVSALMSGVMIKMGLYGIFRVLTLLGAPAPSWGWTLVALGGASAALGALLAVAQSDLKRLLAYSSVENVGLIALAAGLGLLGRAYGTPEVAVLGFAAALLHIWNHALFKSLLFLSAGLVAHATGSRRMDVMGGLLKRMRWTGSAFLVGAAAASGVPPLNGFMSEFLIVLAVLAGLAAWPAGRSSPLAAAIVAMALVGGVAAAVFMKAFGSVFLGSPRRTFQPEPHESGLLMRAPMAALAVLCVAVAFAAPWIVSRALAPAIAALSQGSPDAVSSAAGPLRGALLGTAGLAALAAALAAVRKLLLAGRPVGRTVTWDCGYARPAARMQYTASSFAQPLVSLFQKILRTRRRAVLPEGFFPAAASLSTETPDALREVVYAPVFSGAAWGLGRFRWLQHGRVQLYVLYIMATLFVLMVWGLR
jgi:formate hydrogenlyase subunit 3/multisubunit Na+/H+ antiporter MnhD subunit